MNDVTKLPNPWNVYVNGQWADERWFPYDWSIAQVVAKLVELGYGESVTATKIGGKQ